MVPRRKTGHEMSIVDAFLVLADCLKPGDGATSDAKLRSSLTRGNIDWLCVVSLANRNALTPALWYSLERRGLASCLPPDLADYLALVDDFNRRRNDTIKSQAVEVSRGLVSAGIRPVFMKGCLTLLEGDDAADSSMMTDIDILTAKDETAAASEVLRSLGYRTLGRTSHVAHAATFHRPMSLVTIDLHSDLGPQRRLISADAACRSARPLRNMATLGDGLSVTHRVLLLVMAFGIFETHYPSGHIPLRHLCELSRLCRLYPSQVDWDLVSEILTRNGLDTEAAVLGFMAHELLSAPIPDRLCSPAHGRRHLQRCLSQLASPRIDYARQTYATLTWPFNRFRMDYRYRCGLSGSALLFARLRHAASVLCHRYILAAPKCEGEFS
jgi:hypothetical protein